MVVVVMGVIDIFVALVILGSKFFPKGVLTVAAFYLILKGLVFALSSDFASYIDIAAGAYILLVIAGFSITLMGIIFAIYLIQKGLFSFAA